VTRAWLTALACYLAACSRMDAGAIPQDGAAYAPAEVQDEPGAGRELIPAEWTIAEDTSATGEVTTVSLQLPSAREIGGLLDDDVPRLILRCVDGRIQAFIDTEPAPSDTDASVPDSQSVQVQLDSAPSCE
jgi:hypothetical protein